MTIEHNYSQFLLDLNWCNVYIHNLFIFMYIYYYMYYNKYYNYSLEFQPFCTVYINQTHANQVVKLAIIIILKSLLH